MIGLALSLGWPGTSGKADLVQLAQADVDVRPGPAHSSKVVIEEPRPPSTAIEAEGRAEARNCRPVTVTERQDGVAVTRTDRRCDR